MDVELLEAEALRLEPELRARLAERLFESQVGDDDPEVDREWFEEALARDAELDAGDVGSIPADDVMREARARLG